MGRRGVIALLAATGAVWLLAAGVALWLNGVRTQQPKVPIIGYLASASRDSDLTSEELDERRRQLGGEREVFRGAPVTFIKGLNESGYFRDQNVVIEAHGAGGHYDQLPAMADDMVRRRVSLIVASGGLASAQAAKKATKTIPIPVLFIAGFDPVKIGLVSSLSRPGGNATGVSLYTTELVAKRLELLRELVPGAALVALLVNPKNYLSDIETQDMARAADAAGLQVLVLPASSESDFDPAFDTAVHDRVDALLVTADPFFTTRRAKIVDLAARHGLPAAYPLREYVEIGGLMSYGPDLMEAYHEIGHYAGRILKGAAPGDLPVQLPRTFELAINFKTAAALGLTVSKLLNARADKVIEDKVTQ
jgi:putative tryptophan/tyrosine transport system substrate-binding protein